ncbi:hypothetical protein [Halorubrum laminariae]|uniref:Uncharacterized protein n=1 Tax=Halorubrum laminariae TaxID=1433523 RepID=A0ABD6BY43_9EURY|nr:hypothetical protein [Halorubrum laminariae]
MASKSTDYKWALKDKLARQEHEERLDECSVFIVTDDAKDREAVVVSDADGTDIQSVDESNYLMVERELLVDVEP